MHTGQVWTCTSVQECMDYILSVVGETHRYVDLIRLCLQHAVQIKYCSGFLYACRDSSPYHELTQKFHGIFFSSGELCFFLIVRFFQSSRIVWEQENVDIPWRRHP